MSQGHVLTFPLESRDKACPILDMILTSLVIWFPITSYYKQSGKKNGARRDGTEKGGIQNRKVPQPGRVTTEFIN